MAFLNSIRSNHFYIQKNIKNLCSLPPNRTMCVKGVKKPPKNCFLLHTSVTWGHVSWFTLAKRTFRFKPRCHLSDLVKFWRTLPKRVSSLVFSVNSYIVMFRFFALSPQQTAKEWGLCKEESQEYPWSCPLMRYHKHEDLMQHLQDIVNRWFH